LTRLLRVGYNLCGSPGDLISVTGEAPYDIVEGPWALGGLKFVCSNLVNLYYFKQIKKSLRINLTCILLKKLNKYYTYAKCVVYIINILT
jgi:hypothetical protein